MPFIKAFSVSDGVIASETTPTTEELYIDGSELEATFGCSATEAQLRFVQGVIAAHTNRTSLWPCEYLEELNIPSGRQEVGLSVTPVIQVENVAGRYGFGRRDRIGYANAAYGYNYIFALTSASRPAWSEINVNNIEIVHASGIIYLPTTFYFVPWSIVRIRYIAGYISIPHRVKCAVANILNDMASKGVSDRTRYTVGRITRQFASSTWVSQQTADFLQPFVVTSLY